MNQAAPEILRYKPQGPVMDAFFRSNARRKCLLGPFGSGKSAGNCNEIVRRAKLQMPDFSGARKTRWAVIRNTYGELKHTTVRTWQDWFGPQFGEFLNTSPFEHKMRFGLRADGTTVDCDVIFLAMDTERDVKKFLSLEVTGVFFNEIREVRQAIVDAADGRIGRYPKTTRNASGNVIYGPTWHGIIADTNMPDEDHWLHDLYQRPDRGGWEFFRQPGGVMKVDEQWIGNPDAENLNNLPPGYYTNQMAGKSDEYIGVYLGAEFGRIPEDGAYYTEEMKKAEKDGRIGDVIFDPTLPVHTFWDLGLDDYMAIWFGQGKNGQWNWIDYYENTGKALGHYSKVFTEKAKERGFEYGKEIWPHDGVNRVDGDGDTPERRCDIWKRLTHRDPVILKRHAVGDGIEATRALIGVSRYDRKHCAEGLRHMRRYGREFDDTRNVFKPEPRHDEHSHCADAKRTAAMGKDKCSNDIWAGDYSKFSQGMAVA